MAAVRDTERVEFGYRKPTYAFFYSGVNSEATEFFF